MEKKDSMAGEGRKRLSKQLLMRYGAPVMHEKKHLFEILGVLGALEVGRLRDLQGSKNSKILKEPISAQGLLI